MKHQLRTPFLLSVLALGTLVPSSCIAVAAGAAGAAGYAWYSGEFEATLDAPPREVATAARKALEDLDMKSIKTNATEIDGKVTARSALDKEVVVTIKRKSESTSQVGIRVGTFGDEGLSRTIFEKMKKRL